MSNLMGLRFFSRSVAPPQVHYPAPETEEENARYLVDILLDTSEVRRFEIETVSRAHALWRAAMYAVSMGFWNVSAVEFVAQDLPPDAALAEGARALPH
jgi:hypothetical protein